VRVSVRVSVAVAQCNDVAVSVPHVQACRGHCKHFVDKLYSVLYERGVTPH
jgi:hypothetical protein